MLVKLGVEMHHRRTPFKFFDFWAENPLFLDIVADAWNSQVSGSPPYRFCKRLKLVKYKLKEMNRQQYSNVQQRSAQARVRLHGIQDLMRDNLRNPELKVLERKALEEMLLFQFCRRISAEAKV